MSAVNINFNKLKGYGIMVAELLDGIIKEDEDQIKAAAKSIDKVADDHAKQKLGSMRLHLKKTQ